MPPAYRCLLITVHFVLHIQAPPGTTRILGALNLVLFQSFLLQRTHKSREPFDTVHSRSMSLLTRRCELITPASWPDEMHTSLGLWNLFGNLALTHVIFGQRTSAHFMLSSWVWICWTTVHALTFQLIILTCWTTLNTIANTQVAVVICWVTVNTLKQHVSGHNTLPVIAPVNFLEVPLPLPPIYPSPFSVVLASETFRFSQW